MRRRPDRGATRALDVVRQTAEPGPRDAAAEPRRGALLEPVRLVEDDRVVLGQDAPARRQMREVERVVDDHEVGVRGAFARRLGEARRDERAAAAGAAVRTDGELGPERRRRFERELRPVAGLGLVQERLHRLPRLGVAPVGEEKRLEALQGTPAEVVRAPLQDADVDLGAERGRRDRHVLVEQLLLERLRRRRDHHALPRGERRHEIGEALPHPGPGLGDEVLARRERPLDRLGERCLLGARLVAGQGASEGPAGAEDLVHRGAAYAGERMFPWRKSARRRFVRNLRQSGPRRG
jgi:hypothetical protein